MPDVDHGESQSLGQALPSWQAPPVPNRRILQGQFGAVVPLDVGRDARDLFDALQQDGGQHNWVYLPYGPFTDFFAYKEWLQSMQRKSDPQFYAIVEAATQRAVGVAAYMRIDAANGVIEGPPYHCDVNAMRALFTGSVWTWPKPPYGRVPHPMGHAELAAVLVRR